MSLAKLSLAGNNFIIPGQGSLVSDIPAGNGKSITFFLQCSVINSLVQHAIASTYKGSAKLIFILLQNKNIPVVTLFLYIHIRFSLQQQDCNLHARSKRLYLEDATNEAEGLRDDPTRRPAWLTGGE
jgi:hypothetical protein